MLHKNIMKHAKLLCFAAVSFFATQTAKAENIICEELLSSYHEEDKTSYFLEARTLLDDSAPRASYRELQKANLFLEKLVILQLMEKHECAFPTVARKDYTVPALICGSKSRSHPDCDMDNWESLP